MKNIQLIPTDKPSRLHTYKGVLNLASGEFVAPTIVKIKNDLIILNIYITNDEEIKEGDWFIHKTNADLSLHKCVGRPAKQNVIGNNNIDYMLGYCKKVILTDNEDLIKDGVQVIEDEFLEWLVENPSCEEAEVKLDYDNGLRIIDGKNLGYYCIILKEESKQETLEEAAERILANNVDGLSELLRDDDLFFFYKGVIQCYGEAMAEWQAERMYSEEEVKDLIEDWTKMANGLNLNFPKYHFNKWFEKIKKK